MCIYVYIYVYTHTHMLQVHSTMSYHHTKPNNLTPWYSCLGLSEKGEAKENPIPSLTWIHRYIHVSLSMRVFPIDDNFELVQANSKLETNTKDYLATGWWHLVRTYWKVKFLCQSTGAPKQLCFSLCIHSKGWFPGQNGIKHI